ncbi:pyridoxal-dependent decarboxylase domain protein, partial [Oesophagostomum dentatum]
FFACCTAGTTVYGAFDPIEAVADICEKHKIWFHIDAAWGGGLFLSPEHRHLLKGAERANSITWNPHKLMGALLQCSACLFREKGILMECNKMKADYLFMQDKFYDVSYDTGDKALQCGRHNDIFKLWLMWKSKGMEGYREQINRLMDLSQYFAKRVKETEGFELIMEPEFLNVCFYYIPKKLRNLSVEERNKQLSKPEFLNVCFYYIPKKLRNLSVEERNKQLSKVAPAIKGRMMERGNTMVAYQPEKGRPNFFRLIISNQAI